MATPKVSVIIPNYNHAKYLDQRIQSVLNQTYQDFEVIILDDCSTDNSREVIEQYSDNPHVSQIVYNDVNSGCVIKQWQKGIELAKGELVWIAESDDKNDFRFLETLVGCFEKTDNLALAFSKSWLFNDEGKLWTIDSVNLEEGVYDSHTFISRFMSVGCVMLNASSCLFSKKAFECIDDRYTSFKASGDRMFWTLISEHGSVAIVGERLNYYRKHNTNVTEGGFKKGINQKETKIILDYILEKGYIDKEQYKLIRRRYLKGAVFELLEDDKVKKDIYNYWGYNALQVFSLRLEAWIQKLVSLFKKEWSSFSILDKH